jgi:Integrase core domain
MESFDTLFEAKVLIEDWRLEYNHYRTHMSLGYQTPAARRAESVRRVVLSYACRSSVTDPHFRAAHAWDEDVSEAEGDAVAIDFVDFARSRAPGVSCKSTVPSPYTNHGSACGVRKM